MPDTPSDPETDDEEESESVVDLNVLCQSSVDALTDIIMNGREQARATELNALSYAGSHAGIFNSSRTPYRPASRIDEYIVLAKAVEAMNANPDFVNEVIITVPQIETPPPECAEKLAPLYVQLDEVTKQIEDYSNVGEYMFNAKYPIA